MQASHDAAILRDPIAATAKAQAIWDSTLLEIEKGTTFGPFDPDAIPASIAKPSQIRVARCFGVQQGTKLRLADDATENGVNGAFSTTESADLMPPDCSAVIGCLLFKQAVHENWLHDLDVEASGDDEEHAYRNVTLLHPGLATAYIIDPRSNKVVAVARRGHSFGAAASVNNYCRRPRTLIAIARRAPLTPCDYYIDDLTTVAGMR
jgi:hypothetical protein